jgi:hypothetical protein
MLKIDRKAFLALALGMSVGGCYTSNPPPAVGPATSPAPAAAPAAPQDECIGWTPTGECNKWEPTQECVGWTPTGECNKWEPYHE